MRMVRDALMPGAEHAARAARALDRRRGAPYIAAGSGPLATPDCPARTRGRQMLDLLADPHAWLSLATLAALEIVLGIDNLIFLNIVANRVSPERRAMARRIGLLLALGMRLALLLSLAWVMGLTKPLFSVLEFEVSARDLILLFGGLFLFAKATLEIHHSVEGQAERGASLAHMSFMAAVTQ